jgi:hypothetical protein
MTKSRLFFPFILFILGMTASSVFAVSDKKME